MNLRLLFAPESRWPLLVIIVLTIGVYVPVFQAPFLHDDFLAILDNEDLQNGSFFSCLLSYGHRPVAMAYLFVWVRFLDTSLWGLHLSGLTIHIINLLLVWRLTKKLLEEKKTPFAAWFVTAIFALHPLQTESVSYILQAHMTALAATFYLGALVLYLEKRFAPFVLVLFLGMGVKEVMVTAPIAVFLLEWLVLSKGFSAIPKKRWMVLAVASLSWLVLPTLMFLHFHRGSIEIPYSIAEYAMTQPYVIARYVGLFFVPLWQNIDHHVLPIVSWIDFRFWIFAPALFIGLSGAWYALGKQRLVRFSLAFFFLYLLPSSSLFPLQDVMVEHRIYLAILPLAFLTYEAVRALGPRFMWILILFIAALPVLTFSRNLLYRDGAALWEASTKAVPDNPKSKVTLGLHLMRQGKRDKGVEILLEVITAHPEYPYSYTSVLPVLEQTKQWNTISRVVQTQFQQDLATSEDLALAGKALWYLKRMQQAEAMFDAALAKDSQNSRALYGKGLIARQKPSRWPEAQRLFEKAYQRESTKIDYGVAYAEMLLVADQLDAAQRIVDTYHKAGIQHPYLESLVRKIEKSREKEAVSQ